MTDPQPFHPRPQPEIEAELYRILDELVNADPTSEERVSWWGGQAVALLWALGAAHGDAIDAMYQTWRDRDREDG